MIVIVVMGCVVAFLRTNVLVMVGMLLIAMGIIHALFSTCYRITEEGTLVARCSILPAKRIAIADIEALEASVMPVPSYALSLERIVIWSGGKPWLLVSPTNPSDFIKQLRKINPNIKLNRTDTV